jgi:nucleotide-binding universal stress UspA family protein
MRIKPTAEAGQVLVELDRKDEALLDQAAALYRGPAGEVRLKRILVPVDFSHCTREALDFAAVLARQFGASLAVLNVITPYYAVDPYGMNPPGDFEPDLVSCAEKQLQHLVSQALPPEVSSQTLVRRGRPANEIIEAAKELDADLIVLPTHGHTGLKHVVFGSTAEYVVRHALCPVLTVRAKGQKPEE